MGNDDGKRLLATLMRLLRERQGDSVDAFVFPPPVYATLQGEFIGLDLDAGTLTARFPVLHAFTNPYGMLQGGIIAAAVDNTIGPLSVLVAPLSVTRRLVMTYSRPVTLEMGHIVVAARYVERRGRRLVLQAEVRDPKGTRLARAEAEHYILDEDSPTPLT